MLQWFLKRVINFGKIALGIHQLDNQKKNIKGDYDDLF